MLYNKLRLSIDDDPNVSGQERLQTFLEGLREEDRTRMWQELRDMLSQGQCAAATPTSVLPMRTAHSLLIMNYLILTTWSLLAATFP